MVILGKIFVTILIFALLLSRTPLHELVTKMRQIDVWVLCICILALSLVTLSTAIRWRIILRHLGEVMTMHSLWRFTMIGTFFNQFLPSSMGGDVFRVWYVQVSGVPLGKSVASVVVDRAIGMLGLFALIVTGVPYIVKTMEIGPLRTTILTLAVLLAVAIAVFVRLDLLIRILRKHPHLSKWSAERGRVTRLLNGIERSAANTRSLLGTWPDGLTALALSLANHIILGLVVFLLAWSLGDSLGLFSALVFFPFVLLLSMLPISMAGWGLREGAMVVVFALLGMPKETALSVSILFGICQLLSGLPGGVLWLLRHSPLPQKSGDLPS